MQASEAEFRWRFWIIFGVFAVAFNAYLVDHEMAAAALGFATVRPVIAAGAVIVALSALLRTWAAAYLRTDVVKDTRVHTDRLVADGPYRFVRNPLYLGTFGLALGMASLLSRTGAVILIAGMLVVVWRLTGREEHDLLATQGESYRAYAAAVPRFVPSLRPRAPGSGAAPRWGQALWGELLMWAMAAGMLAVVSGRPRLAYWIWGAGVLQGLVAGRAARSRAAA